MTNRQQGATEHSRWAAFYQSFRESNYITDFWNWLMTLTSKAAEMVLFGSVLYSGYELIPGVAHAPAEVDAMIFVIQQGALDVGGMGLLKLARRAGLPRDSFPMRVGIILVSLMIANVILASVKQTLPMTPGWVLVSLETLLLVARAVMAVLFGHAIHALREEYGESMITVQEARVLQGRLEELTQHLSETVQQVQQQWAQDLRQVHLEVQQGFTQQLTQVTEQVQVQGVQSEQVYTQVSELLNQVNRLKGELQAVQSQVQGVHSTLERHEGVHRGRACVSEGYASCTPEQGSEPLNRVNPLALTEQQGVNPKREPLHLVHSSAQVNPKHEPAKGADTQRVNPVNPTSEPGETGTRVQRFMLQAREQGRTPTLKEIMQTCQCSKNTAIRYRRAWCETKEGEEPEPPCLSSVGA